MLRWNVAGEPVSPSPPGCEKESEDNGEASDGGLKKCDQVPGAWR